MRTEPDQMRARLYASREDGIMERGVLVDDRQWAEYQNWIEARQSGETDYAA